MHKGIITSGSSTGRKGVDKTCKLRVTLMIGLKATMKIRGDRVSPWKTPLPHAVDSLIWPLTLSLVGFDENIDTPPMSVWLLKGHIMSQCQNQSFSPNRIYNRKEHFITAAERTWKPMRSQGPFTNFTWIVCNLTNFTWIATRFMQSFEVNYIGMSLKVQGFSWHVHSQDKRVMSVVHGAWSTASAWNIY